MLRFVQKVDMVVFNLCLKDGMNMDPFFYIKNNVVSDEKNLQMTAASAFKLFRAVGMIGIVATLLIVGIQFLYAKKGSKLEEVKSRLVIETVIGGLIFSFLFWLEQIFYIAGRLAG